MNKTITVTSETKESWFLQINEELDSFQKCLDDKINEKQQKIKACKEKHELESKMAQEKKLNAELTARLLELTQRTTEMDRMCTALQTRLNISDGDRNRLENAKESYQIAKELTGVRFDFSAPPNVARGYIKNEKKKLLQPFEMDADSAEEKIWDLLQATTENLENQPLN